MLLAREDIGEWFGAFRFPHTTINILGVKIQNVTMSHILSTAPDGMEVLGPSAPAWLAFIAKNGATW